MLKDIQSTGTKDTRSGFGDGIVEAARNNSNVVALTADLAGSLKLQQFMKEFPERYIQCGIAEANMMGIAAGLTIGGKIPFTTTFANFSTGRVYDQIRQSIAYSGKNVKICASHANMVTSVPSLKICALPILKSSSFEKIGQAGRPNLRYTGPSNSAIALVAALVWL